MPLTPTLAPLAGRREVEGLGCPALVERAVEAGGDVEVFRVVRAQQSVPQRKIEDHQVHVELEIVGRTDSIENC